MHIEKRGLVISDWNFGEGMETKSAGEKVKKKGMTKYHGNDKREGTKYPQ